MSLPPREVNHAEMRAYLLGTLADDRRSAVEERIFDDETTYDALVEAQYDLLDDYARGELPPGERQQVEARLLAGVKPETLDLSRMLATRGAVGDRSAAPRPTTAGGTYWPRLLAAAATLAVATTAWLAVDNERLRTRLAVSREASTPPAPTATQPPAAPPAPRLTLSARTTRGDGTVPVATLPPDATLVEMVLPVDELHPDYQVALEGPGGRLWFQRLATRSPDGAIHVWIPMAVLRGGVYEVLVFAGQGETPPLVAAFSTRIQR
jgi:hypothetical protein